MSISADEIECVRARIATAFEDAAAPREDELVDLRGYNPEALEVANAFRGKGWRAVTKETVAENAGALTWFLPAAFRYYLPAYMTAVAGDYYGMDVAPESVLFALTPPRVRNGRQWDRFRVRTAGFTDLQRDAIVGFLELFRRYEVADWASGAIDPPEDRVGPALEYWRCGLAAT